MIDDSPRFILSYTESLNIVLTSGLIFSYFRFFTPLFGLSLPTLFSGRFSLSHSSNPTTAANLNMAPGATNWLDQLISVSVVCFVYRHDINDTHFFGLFKDRVEGGVCPPDVKPVHLLAVDDEFLFVGLC
ncbi:hypothetical protein BRC95_07050 [Halobacteriales archaeon QS_5_68_33]|nr:MAG: hypothetical protein BRC95_07050 [Halobacteriales archaeon QS_5_68_33]